MSPEQADKMIKNPEAYKMRPSETRYLRESMGLPRAQFFSPSGNEVGQIASATSDLSGLFSQLPSDYKETEQETIKAIKDNEFNKYLKKEFGTDDINYGDKQFLRESFDEGNPYKRFNYDTDQSFVRPTTDTKVAMLGNEDNLGGPAAFLGGVLTIGAMDRDWETLIWITFVK